MKNRTALKLNDTELSMDLSRAMIPVPDLDDGTIRQMFHLMSGYYDNLVWEHFSRDLTEKQTVILIRDNLGAVRGFSTICLLDIPVGGTAVKGVFTGDTVLDRHYWGDLNLHLEFANYLFGYAMKKYKDTRLFWCLISKGYKTYRLIQRYFKNAYPNHLNPTPEFEKTLMEKFATMRYPDRYDREKGIIKADGEHDFVKSGVAEISESHLDDPVIRYFSEKNPGYRQGDELVCIAEVHPSNFRREASELIRILGF